MRVPLKHTSQTLVMPSHPERKRPVNADPRITAAAESVAREAALSGGQPLDAATRMLMESRFGHDFGSVRVHSGPRAAVAARAVGAEAYTIGQDVVLGQGAGPSLAAANQALMAHELTHVVQQTRPSRPGGESSAARAENEAQRSARQVAGGLSVMCSAAADYGALQRQETKKKGPSGGVKTESGFTRKPEEIKNKFEFSADMTVPVSSRLKLGPVAFLDSLKITATGTKTGEEPIPLGGTDIPSLQTTVALDVASLSIKKAPGKSGPLSFSGKLQATGGPTFAFGAEPSVKGSLGASASLTAGLTTKPLLSSKWGELTLGTGLTGKGAVSQGLGAEGEFKPSAGATLGLSADYKSRPSRSPVLTLGGILGEQATFSAGAESGFSASVKPKPPMEPETPTVPPPSILSSQLSAGGSLGLSGTRKGGPETFVKITVKGSADLDPRSGEFDAKSKSFVVGIGAGVKF